MALSNALLIKYALGYRWATDSASIAALGRREGYLELGAVTSVSEVDRIAAAIFSTRSTPRMAVSASIEPQNDANTPYLGFQNGDYIVVPDPADSPTSMRVMAITVTEDREGNPTFIPELGSLRDEKDRTTERTIKRLSNGSLGGTVESASPSLPSFGPKQKITSTTGFVFSQPGPVASVVSGRWYPAESVKATELVVSLATVATDNLTINLLKNNVVEETIVIPAGSDRQWKSILSLPFAITDFATVESVVGADGGSDLTVLVRVTR